MSFLGRFRNQWRERQLRQDFDDELRFHYDSRVSSNLAKGLSSAEAHTEARRHLGNLTLAREGMRGARVLWLDDLIRDVRYAARQLRRSPGFTATAVLCLALGIGGTTAIYSVVNTVLLRPLPFRDSDRLVRVVEHVPPSAPGRPVLRRGIPHADIVDWTERAGTLSDGIAVTGIGQRLVRAPGGAAGLWGAATSTNAFTALGVRAMLGRAFDDGDAANADVVVLTFDTWQRHFNADPGVVGTAVELRAATLQEPVPPRMLTVVGVLPSDFEFPAYRADFYVPLRSMGPAMRVTMIGRLAPTASLEAATDELNAFGAASRPPWPDSAPALTGPRFEVQRLKDVTIGDLRHALGLFLAAVAVVLLIVCANVANLMLARGTAR